MKEGIDMERHRRLSQALHGNHEISQPPVVFLLLTLGFKKPTMAPLHILQAPISVLLTYTLGASGICSTWSGSSLLGILVDV